MSPLPSPPVRTRPLGPAFPSATARPGVPAARGFLQPAARRVVGGRWCPASDSYGRRRLPLHSSGREKGCDVQPRPRPGLALPVDSRRWEGGWCGGGRGAEGLPHVVHRSSPHPSWGCPCSRSDILSGGCEAGSSYRAAAGLLGRKTNLCRRPAARRRLPAFSARRCGAPSSPRLRWDAFVCSTRSES